MKRKKTEYSIRELQKLSEGMGTKVPHGFRQELSDMIDSMDAAEQMVTSRRNGALRAATWIMGAAAGIMIILGVSLAILTFRSPADTFSDPQEAYAEAEKALVTISARMSSAAEKAGNAQSTVTQQIELMMNIY